MKKIFTLFAAAAMTLCASAQDIYKAPGENIKAETDLVDNEDLSVKTVYTSKGGAQEVSMFGEDFTGWFQLRVSGDPNADNLTGDEQADSTPLIVAIKKALKLTFYVRRQKGSEGYNAGDNKGLLALNQTTLEKVVPTSTELDRYDGKPDETTGVIPDSYGFCTETFDFTPGIYTIYRKGSTVRVFGFAWEAGEDPDVPGDEALMSWDFTKWSEATVANLKAANADNGNWTDIEKANADPYEPTEASKDNCFWQVNAAEGLSADKFVMANGEVIAELKGLVYTNTKNRVLAIAVNYPAPDANSGFGPYHGPQYLWFNSKEVYWFTIPNVPAGAIIKMGVESHKLTDARGVKLYIGEETLKAPDGSEVAIGKEYQDNEWLVPATAEATNDVKIQSTNGCHIYYITVTAGEGGTTAVEAVELENAPVEYYNLQGVRVANPENGLYIKRQGNKAVKVLVK